MEDAGILHPGGLHGNAKNCALAVTDEPGRQNHKRARGDAIACSKCP
jgi:hypothetical protein